MHEQVQPFRNVNDNVLASTSDATNPSPDEIPGEFDLRVADFDCPNPRSPQPLHELVYHNLDFREFRHRALVIFR